MKFEEAFKDIKERFVNKDVSNIEDIVANKERYGGETYQYLNCKNYGRSFRYCCSCVAKLEGICEGFKEIEAGDNTIEHKD